MAYDKRQATSEFTRWSRNYDDCVLQWLLFGPTHRVIIRQIESQCSEPPARILDVGCGTGLFAERIKAAIPTANVWGADLVSGMLTNGAQRWSRLKGDAQPVQADSERLPFPSGSFDVVTCAHSFHHYPHQFQAVREMHRVLRGGGLLLLADGYRDAPWGWLIYDVCVTSIEGNVHHASSKRMRGLFAEAGFAATSQKVHRGAAPFLITQGRKAPSAIPAPHLSPQPESVRNGQLGS